MVVLPDGPRAPALGPDAAVPMRLAASARRPRVSARCCREQTYRRQRRVCSKRGSRSRKVTSSPSSTSSGHRHSSIVGGVYKGVVTNVLPGMQAAFVDIGLAKDAFLYAGDYTPNLVDVPRPEPVEDRRGRRRRPRPRHRGRRAAPPARPPAPIEEMLSRKGQTSSCRSPRSRSGPRARASPRSSRCPAATSSTCRRPATSASPAASGTSASAIGCAPRCAGSSCRPAASSCAPTPRARARPSSPHDVEFLRRLWAQIRSRLRDGLGAGRRCTRRATSPSAWCATSSRPRSTSSSWTTATPTTRCSATCRRWCRRWPTACGSTTSAAPVFDAFGIEKDIEKALRRRVWLKSGGYIVIDHTEALVSIDVNTGKYVGKRDFEQTVLKINLEAVDRGRAPDPPARPRRHHHHRLHRHGGARAPRAGLQGGQARAGRGQGAHQRAGDLRAGAGAR